MPVILLETLIHAPRERVFDLARSIDAHQASASQTHERAIAGVTRGLINAGESVTWEARHFGVTQRLTVEITQLNRPFFFQDVMRRGAFARMTHDHLFETVSPGSTLMKDRFDYAAPLGPLGKIVERLVLTRHLRAFLLTRNAHLKTLAESPDAWRPYLNLWPEPSGPSEL